MTTTVPPAVGTAGTPLYVSPVVVGNVYDGGESTPALQLAWVNVGRAVEATGMLQPLL